MCNKNVFKRITALLLVTLFCVSCLGLCAFAEKTELTAEQRNAIAMLNYITVLTQEINASKNSRLYLEEAYSSLINNTYPNAVDYRTQSQLTGLLDTMESYRMIDVKRDRLQFIYEQNQAQAIRAAIPNPLALLSVVQSFRPEKLVAAIVYMAADSVTSYMAYTNESDLKYISDGWALDDEEAAVLHNSRKGTFSYMISMVRDNNLPGDLTLTESSVEELVNWKNNDNVVARIRFLESNQNTYQFYGGYWLMLAESYYEHEDYTQALEALHTYEAVKSRIFRRDYELARILPLMISAADHALEGEEYITFASQYAQLLLDNTDHDDWTLRYFASQVFVDLYTKTQDKTYLRKAYEIALDNVNYLTGEQKNLNVSYLNPVQEKKTPKDATKAEKTQIANYNKLLKEARKTELPPVSEPLLLNCELLFALSSQLNITQSDKLNIEGILHAKGEPIFLTAALDDKYWFIHEAETTPIEIEFGGTAMIIPARILTPDANIIIEISDPGSEETTVIDDWIVDEVKRVTEDVLSSYQAVFTSNEARKFHWQADQQITVLIEPKEGAELQGYQFSFLTHSTKKAWYDYLKFWEGHKNRD